MEKQYETVLENEGFRQLADTVGRGRDDSRLCELVLSLHSKMQSHARPEKWALEQMEKLELRVSDAGETEWGAEIMRSLRSSADFWSEAMEDAVSQMRGSEKIYKAYGESFAETAASLRDFSRALGISWDAAADKLPIAFPRIGGLRNSPDPELSEYAKALRARCRDEAEEYAQRMPSHSDKLIREQKLTAPAMKALLELTLSFDRAFTAEKRRRSELDFSDLEHLTAKLLTFEDGSPTPLALELSRRYTEIMVDEYQDVNRVQDMIFRAVSRNGKNLFMVGDIKQSIYRFRLADPTIFTEKYLAYKDIGKAAGDESARIMLQENFRSRKEVIDAVNSIFRSCMSRSLGDVDYDENAMLRCGAAYPSSAEKPELVLISRNGSDTDSMGKNELEAEYAARRIKELVDGGAAVTEGGELRRVRYGDIAMLMRSANTTGEIYRRALIKAGIPVMSGQGGSFFESAEISSLICLLAVIDNPHQDIALISALRSPAFGFTADELSMIRTADKGADYYTALTKAAQSDAKCAAFLEKLSLLRSLAPDTELGELLWRIYDELDLLAIYSGTDDGGECRGNLLAMLSYASRF